MLNWRNSIVFFELPIMVVPCFFIQLFQLKTTKMSALKTSFLNWKLFSFPMLPNYPFMSLKIWFLYLSNHSISCSTEESIRILHFCRLSLFLKTKNLLQGFIFPNLLVYTISNGIIASFLVLNTSFNWTIIFFFFEKIKILLHRNGYFSF